MATRQIRLDVPDARRRGVAILRGWRRDIRAVLAGPADRASIERTDDPDDFFDGVAYDLSWWGKTRLDRREERAYSSIDVVVEINGVEHDAFTYIPLPKPEPDELPGRDSWIDLVVDGANENKMDMLLRELRSHHVNVNGDRRVRL
jgi:hypothetical protein